MKIENTLTGKIVSNSYIIREAVLINPFYSIWHASSIYSAVRNLIEIVPKKFLNSDIKDLKEVLNNNFISSIKEEIEDLIAPIIEISELENNYCFIINIQEGETVKNFVEKRKLSSEIYTELFLNISKIIELFYEKNFFIPYFDQNFFWMTNSRKIILFNHSFYLLRKEIILKQRRKIQKYLIKTNKHFTFEEKNKIEKKNNSILLGFLFYSLLLGESEIKKINKNIKQYENSENKELIKYIAELIDKKKEYNYDNLIKDLENLIKKKSKTAIQIENEKKLQDSKSTQRFYDYELSDRRLYFELLEKERKEKLEKLKKETEPHLIQDEKSIDYYLDEYEKRKKYFENLEKERELFLESIIKDNEKNKDKLAQEAGNYFKTLFSENKNEIKIEEYFNKLKESIENHIKDLKEKSTNFFNTVLHIKNEGKIQTNYIKEKLEDTKEKFIEIYDSIKNYYYNFLKNNLNQIKEATKIKLKNIENITKNTIYSIDSFTKDFIEIYNKAVPVLNEEIEDNKKEISLKEGIDIIKIEKVKTNFLERFLAFLKFLLLFILNKINSQNHNIKKSK